MLDLVLTHFFVHRIAVTRIIIFLSNNEDTLRESVIKTLSERSLALDYARRLVAKPEKKERLCFFEVKGNMSIRELHTLKLWYEEQKFEAVQEEFKIRVYAEREGADYKKLMQKWEKEYKPISPKKLYDRNPDEFFSVFVEKIKQFTPQWEQMMRNSISGN